METESSLGWWEPPVGRGDVHIKSTPKCLGCFWEKKNPTVVREEGV